MRLAPAGKYTRCLDVPAMTELPPPSDLPARLGKLMLLGAWAVGLIIVILFFQRLMDEARNPNRDLQGEQGPGGIHQVVLQRNRAGHYVADGTINGHPVVFLLDTGATQVALPLDLARRLGLPLRPGGIGRTANGDVQTWATRLDRVSLGGLAAQRVPATVLPAMQGDEVLLGMSYLKRFELIQKGDTLTLRAQPH
jgi:aspartyl protease family protein